MQYKSDLQDYNDQNAYLGEVRGSMDTGVYERHIRVYDAQGRLVVDQGLKENGSLKTMMVNDAFDAAGNVIAYHSDAMVNDHIRSDYTNTYKVLAGSVVQASSTGHMTVLSGKLSGKTGSNATTTNIYDASGNLVGVDYTTAGNAPKSGTSKKIFIVDAHGNILLSREQSWNSPTVEQRQILVGDELELRYSTNYGSFGDIQDEQKKAFWDAYNADAYQSMVTPGGTITAEAGVNPTTGQVVVVRDGDTLQSIALRVYGTADAWYRLADANRLDRESKLVAGSTLVAPAAAANSNTLDFNTGKLIGSTAPNLPPPPPGKKNCITLLIVAVAVVVACVVSQGMLSFAAGLVGGTGTTATVVAGGLTAAAANVASQAVGIVAGVQDGLNWKSVGMSALGGAIGAGFGNLTSYAAVNAAASNAVTQFIGVKIGVQEKFSWAAVAGSAAGAAIQQGMEAGTFGEALKQVKETDQFTKGFVRGGLSGFAGSLTTDLLTPGKMDWAQIGIAAVQGGLTSGLEAQRQYNGARGVPFLFDAELEQAGDRAVTAVRKAFSNAFGSAIGQSIISVSPGATSRDPFESFDMAGIVADSPRFVQNSPVKNPLRSLNGNGAIVSDTSVRPSTDRLLLSSGSTSGIDAPSDVFLFVEKYIEEHLNASHDEVQTAFDRTQLSSDQVTALEAGYGPLNTQAARLALASGGGYGLHRGALIANGEIGTLPTTEFLGKTVELANALGKKGVNLYEYYGLNSAWPNKMADIPVNLFSDYEKRANIYVKGLNDAAISAPIPGQDASVEEFKEVMERRQPVREQLLLSVRDRLSEAGLNLSERLKPRGALPDYEAKYRAAVVIEAGLDPAAFPTTDTLPSTDLQKEVYKRTAIGAVTSNDGFSSAAVEAAELSKSLRVANGITSAGRWGGGALGVIGASADGYSFGQELNKSLTTGNYSNTAAEGVRIAGGWAGASAVAGPAAVQGATWGSAFGPIGIAVGGVGGGLIGGAFGYAGSYAATRLWSGTVSGWNSLIFWLKH